MKCEILGEYVEMMEDFFCSVYPISASEMAQRARIARVIVKH